jgi:DNA-binding MarR family transcriptional regulator
MAGFVPGAFVRGRVASVLRFQLGGFCFRDVRIFSKAHAPSIAHRSDVVAFSIACYILRYVIDDVIRQLGYLALGTRLKRLGERMQAQTQHILDSHGLEIQAAQFPFLAAIARMGPSTIGELAEAVGYSQPAATRTLAQLAESGFVVITVTPDDQRRKSVALSKQGRRLVDIGKRVVWPQIDAAVKGLCAELSGPLLDQLAAIEDGLVAQPLATRSQR